MYFPFETSREPTDMPIIPLSAAFLPRGNSTIGDETTKTLWIFGAGASAHLDFPLSWGFFRSTVSHVTSYFKEPNDLSDPVKAFDLIESWIYTEPADANDRARLQFLVTQLRKLRRRLEAVGIQRTTEDLLNVEPEKLIERIRFVAHPKGQYF